MTAMRWAGIRSYQPAYLFGFFEIQHRAERELSAPERAHAHMRHGSRRTTLNNPVVDISWCDANVPGMAQQTLSQSHQLWRLPTEAEWGNTLLA